MTYKVKNCLDTKNSMNLRKGLAAIANRKTGLVLSLPDEATASAVNVAAPKEISAAKCSAKSFLSL